MSGTPPIVWQVSGGPASRSYADVFLKYGVALIGPGDSGPWTPEQDDSAFDGPFVRRFAVEIAAGDVLLLRTGLATLAAVGLVDGNYQYLSAFDDVNGWDLQHARRVRWHRLPAAYTFSSAVFGANPPRFSRVWNEEVVDYARRFVSSSPVDWQSSKLPELASEDPALEPIPEPLAELVAQVADLMPLYWDDETFGDRPSEDELIVHLVVPLLRRLGWPPERIAIKWRHTDVTVFRALPRTPENCMFVIEAKRLGAGVEGALAQGRTYVEALGVACDVIVTDGVRYRMYDSTRGFTPVAYANLARLKRPAEFFFRRIQRPSGG